MAAARRDRENTGVTVTLEAIYHKQNEQGQALIRIEEQGKTTKANIDRLERRFHAMDKAGEANARRQTRISADFEVLKQTLLAKQAPCASIHTRIDALEVAQTSDKHDLEQEQTRWTARWGTLAIIGGLVVGVASLGGLFLAIYSTFHK